MTTSTIATCDHGMVTRTKRVILDRDTYAKKWKLGPFAKKKEELKAQGGLDKYGRIVDKTPEAWKMLFGDAEKATNITEVANAVGAKGGKAAAPEKKPEKKAAPAKTPEPDSDADSDKQEKKRDKKKKEKKEKKDKKEKKSKKAKKDDSDDSD